VGERSADHGAAAESHDRHTGRHATSVREPFHQGRDRRNITEAETDAADHARAKPKNPKLMSDDADRAKYESTTPAQRRYNAGLARASPFKPTAPKCGGRAEHNEEQGIHPAEAGHAPVACGCEQFGKECYVLACLGLGATYYTGQRQPEHAEAVGH